jgi:hypothetical protein
VWCVGGDWQDRQATLLAMPDAMLAETVAAYHLLDDLLANEIAGMAPKDAHRVLNLLEVDRCGAILSAMMMLGFPRLIYI